MIPIPELRERALKTGFTLAEPIRVETIQLRDEVRDMCAADKCHAYNRNWSCPPACGTIEECRERLQSYEVGLLVQTTGKLEDDFDFETMQETSVKHGEYFRTLLKEIRRDYPGLQLLPLCTGACMNCETCTYPDAPCRFPEVLSTPMEGYGMVISDVCRDNNIVYNHGRGTLTYVACYLFREAAV